LKKVSLSQVKRVGVSHDPPIMKQVLLERGDIPHLTHFSIATMAKGKMTTAHSHGDLYEAFYVASGSGLIRIDGQATPIEPQTIVVVEPGETHEITNTGETELTLIYFGIESPAS
jgi:mannose-6-phosphate isomerase-like protein (cupin superfamily)